MNSFVQSLLHSDQLRAAAALRHLRADHGERHGGRERGGALGQQPVDGRSVARAARAAAAADIVPLADYDELHQD